MPLWTKEGIYITLFALPHQAIEIVVRCSALSEQYTHKCAKRYARATQSAWTLPRVPVAQNRISGGVAQKLLYALQHLCQCHSAGSSKHSSQHRYR